MEETECTSQDLFIGREISQKSKFFTFKGHLTTTTTFYEQKLSIK
ncbi:hypothetical protein CTL2C_902 [Chlamydia trachomatis L2c]|nr:hypothetical protein CTL2C_902 [Chlamydia trachomatis L2c]